MVDTVISTNHTAAQKKWAATLTVEFKRKSFFEQTMVGLMGTSLPIQRLTELEKTSGDKITYHLNAQLDADGSEGDDTTTAEDLQFHAGFIHIDQKRKKVAVGGKMTQQRTDFDLKKIAKDRLVNWFSDYMDEQYFIYLSGGRGSVKNGYITPLDFTGRANNPVNAPSASHHIFAGGATSENALTTADSMSLLLIEKLIAKADSMLNDDIPAIQPTMVNGKQHYCLIMSPFQEYTLRTESGTSSWLEIQKAAAGATGENSKLFKGSLGVYNNVVLHKHSRAIRYNDFGAGNNVEGARAIFLGAQAGVYASGGYNKGDSTMWWFEEMVSSGNNLEITGSNIFGISKTRFKDKDYGVIVLSTAATDPNG